MNFPLNGGARMSEIMVGCNHVKLILSGLQISNGCQGPKTKASRRKPNHAACV